MQLLRDNRSKLQVEDKRAINDACSGIFEALRAQVAEFEPTDQQILVLELSQLGIVFISPEWHSFCPPVPVQLLNGLLDGLLLRLRKLRGDQVGVLLISLQRLQLSDRDAYAKILDEIKYQLKAAGPNTWYRQHDKMGKLVRGVATVFLVCFCLPAAHCCLKHAQQPCVAHPIVMPFCLYCLRYSRPRSAPCTSRVLCMDLAVKSIHCSLALLDS